MKKSLLFIFCGILIAANFNARAQSGQTGEVSWNLNTETGLLTITGNGAMADYAYPADAPWYAQRASITTLTIGSGVTAIGKNAFAGTAISTVTIPEAIINIGDRAFSNCTALKTVNFNAIECENMGIVQASTGPVIGGGIDTRAFSGCELTAVNFGNRVTVIADFAFYSQSGLTTANIPATVEYIGTSAFSGTGLTSVTIPEMVENIGSLAFGHCSNLTTVTFNAIECYALKNDVFVSYGTFGFWESRSAFLGSNLSMVNFGHKVTAIPDRLFENYKDIKTVTLPETVEYIGDYAFSGTGLTSITIPEAVEYLGEGALKNCADLVTINFNAVNCDINIYRLPFEYCENVTQVNFGNKVTKIIGFGGLYKLETVIFGNSITVIGQRAFENCIGLKSITIPQSVMTIEQSAFSGCTGLEMVTLSETLKTIENSVFNGCTDLKTVTIGSSVTTIGYEAFRYCTNLTNIINLAPEPQAINANVFYNVPVAQCLLRVPAASVSKYRGANTWSGFQIVGLNGVSVSGVSLNKTTLTIPVRESETLTATVSPSNADIQNVTWSSSNMNVAEVSQNGLVTAKATGAATITVTTLEGKFTAECAVTVVPAMNAQTPVITVQPQGASVTANAPVTLTVTASVSDGGTLSYQWAKSVEGSPVAITGATGSTYSPPTSEEGETEYCVLITNTNTSVSGNTVVTVQSAWATVKVIGVLYANYFANSETVSDWTLSGVSWDSRNNGMLLFTTNSTTATTPAVIPEGYANMEVTVTSYYGSYLYLQTSPDGVTWSPNTYSSGSANQFTGGNSNVVSTLPIPDGTRYLRFQARNSGVSNDVYLIDVTVTGEQGGIVNAQTPVISQQPQSANVSVNGSVTLSVTASVTDGGTLNYQWYSNTSNSTVNGYPITGATGTTYAPPTNTAGTVYYYVEVANVNDGVNGSQVAKILSAVATVTVTGGGATTYTVSCGISGAYNGFVNATVNGVSQMDNTFQVAQGATVVFNAVPSAGYRVKSWTDNNVAVNGANPTYTISNISANHDVKVAFEADEGSSGGCETTIGSGNVIATMTWELCDNGVLTISGTGAMPDYEFTTNYGGSSTSPWGSHKFSITSVVINSGVTSIGDLAFFGCGNLGMVYIAESVKTIGDNAFEHCSRLSSVTIPTGVTSIGNTAFGDCESLGAVSLPATLKTISNHAFYGCTALSTVTIPSSVTFIGSWAFSECTGLTSVTVHWTTPLAVSSEVFYDLNTQNIRLYVPQGTEEKYLADEVWGKFNIQGGSSIPVITITTHPAATTTVTQGSISGSLAVAATVNPSAALTYQWFNTTSTLDQSTEITGATGASFAIPDTLMAGTYYYFCEIRATGATSVRSNVATVTVVVQNINVTGVSLNKTAATLTVGATERLTATVAPANATNQSVTWSSGNNAVATIDNLGTVTAVSSGTTVITVKTQDGNFTATCAVTVTAALQNGSAVLEGTVTGASQGTTVYLYVHTSDLKAGGLDNYVLVAVTQTDASGKYRFTGLPEGTYRVVVEKEGYTSTPSADISLTGTGVTGDINFTINGNGTITPNNPDITGTDDVWIEDLKIYPNPFTDVVRITGVVETLRATSLRVVNAAGVVVHTQLITSPDEVIRLEHLPDGVYMLTIGDGKQMKTVKVIKN